MVLMTKVTVVSILGLERGFNLVICCWLLVICYWLLVIGYLLLIYQITNFLCTLLFEV